jgi:hypothetical protein
MLHTYWALRSVTAELIEDHGPTFVIHDGVWKLLLFRCCREGGGKEADDTCGDKDADDT